jgi:phospholipid/cholesterol/gamma-HCH transport system ATP-binding protein
VNRDAADAAHVELRSVQLSFGTRSVFEDLTCRVPRARITVMMGGSGAGKSTVLRMVGGLLRPSSGVVAVAGVEIQDLDERRLAEVRRHLGMLFQNGALLDSMTVFDNVALPLREHTALSEAEIRSAVLERLDDVGLPDIAGLLPGQLSGGMLRRAALARAIVESPEILLCDEPFSGLDPPNVERIEALLRRLNRERGLTVIVTSHHMATSLRMSDQIVLLRDGHAICGHPRELASSSDDRIVQFLGADGRAYLAALESEKEV